MIESTGWLGIESKRVCLLFIGQENQYPLEQDTMWYQLKDTFCFFRVFNRPNRLRIFLVKYLLGLEFYEVKK